jgi:gluconate kinase
LVIEQRWLGNQCVGVADPCYRNRLRAALPSLKFASRLSEQDAPRHVAKREAHSMLPSLEASQFQTLLKPIAEPNAFIVDVTSFAR